MQAEHSFVLDLGVLEPGDGAGSCTVPRDGDLVVTERTRRLVHEREELLRRCQRLLLVRDCPWADDADEGELFLAEPTLDWTWQGERHRCRRWQDVRR